MSLSRDKKSATRVAPTPEALLLPRLQQWAAIPRAEWRFLHAHVRLRELAPGEMLTRAGEVATRFGFMLDGLMRKVHVTARGKSVVRGFARRGDFVGAYASILSGQKSYLNVEALTNARLFEFDSALLPELYARHACWQTLGRRIAEELLLEREARAHELLTLSATERYARFCETHREILPQLRAYDIASYLGITPVSLSRLRARRHSSASRKRPNSASSAGR